MTQYAIIGSGNIGSALARLFARAGVEVGIANTRGPESLRPLTETLGSGVHAVTLEEALRSEVIFLAIPFPAVERFGGSLPDWTGKIVVDATNAHDAADVLRGRPSSRYVADRLPGAAVVKAFNQLPAGTLAAELDPGLGRRVIFIATDTSEAGDRIAELVDALGLAAVRLGRLDEGGRLIEVPNALVLRDLVELSKDDRPLERLDARAQHLLFTGARTANSFADTPVSDAELTDIWELARWAPTSANSQPLRVLYVRRGEARDRLVKHLDEGNRAKTASAPAVAVLALDTRFHEHLPTVLPIKPELKDVFAANDAKRMDTATFNATLQAGYFILAVRAHGLAAGPMGGFDTAGVDAEFFPDGRYRSILVVNIGHPGENPWFPRLPRLDHEDVVQWA
jgi:3-hydroxypropanoate dehydrogenase